MKAAAAILLSLLLFLPRSKALGIYGMKKSEFLPPYTDGKTTFRDAVNKAGVYVIKNSAKQIVYVGYSRNNLYRTLYRHFQKWDDSQQPRITYGKHGYTVRVIITTPDQATRLEKYLIKKMKPRDNSVEYDNTSDTTGQNDFEKAKEAETWEPAPF